MVKGSAAIVIEIVTSHNHAQCIGFAIVMIVDRFKVCIDSVNMGESI